MALDAEEQKVPDRVVLVACRVQESHHVPSRPNHVFSHVISKNRHSSTHRASPITKITPPCSTSHTLHITWPLAAT